MGASTSDEPSLRVGYVVSRFPQLSETFIVREMNTLASRGVDVRLYPLLRQDQPIVHAEARAWLSSARYGSRPVLSCLLGAVRLAVRRPSATASMVRDVVRGFRSAPRGMVKNLVMLPMAVRVADCAHRDQVDHLHAHFATFPLLAAWVAHRLHGLPYSVTVHAHDIFMGTQMLSTRLQGARAVVAISHFNARFLRERVDHGLTARTHVIHCGVDPDRYSAPMVDGATDGNGVIQMVSIGSLQPYKGQLHLISACARLHARGVPFRCRIVGEGGERAALESAITASGLNHRVELLGARDEDEVRQLLRSATLYVQPSIVASTGQMEGIPVALMEAMASSRPVIATRLSGVPELVRHEITGLLVEPADPEGLADAVERLYRDPGLTSQLARAGRALVQEEFNLARCTQRLHTLLSRRGCGSPEGWPPAGHY